MEKFKKNSASDEKDRHRRRAGPLLPRHRNPQWVGSDIPRRRCQVVPTSFTEFFFLVLELSFTFSTYPLSWRGLCRILSGFFSNAILDVFFVLVRLIKFQQRSVTSLPGFLTEFDLKKSRRPSHSFHPKGFSFNFPTTVSSMAAVSWCRSIEFRRQRTILCCCRFFVYFSLKNRKVRRQRPAETIGPSIDVGETRPKK